MKKISFFADEERDFAKLKYKGKSLGEYNYLQGVQGMIEKEYRNKSIFL